MSIGGGEHIDEISDKERHVRNTHSHIIQRKDEESGGGYSVLLEETVKVRKEERRYLDPKSNFCSAA